jgi:hypothetical protein
VFSINQFKQSGLVYGGARPSLFQVIVNQDVTSGLTLPSTALTKLPFVCRASQLPASMIETIRVPYMGRTIKVAGSREFEDWNVVIMNDEDFLVREMFESWQNSINALEANLRDPALAQEGYKVDFNVRQFSIDGTIIRSYKIVGAYPSRVSSIDLDWDAANQIETFSVVFSYDYWIPDEADEAVTTLPYLDFATTNPPN